MTTVAEAVGGIVAVTAWAGTAAVEFIGYLFVVKNALLGMT